MFTDILYTRQMPHLEIPLVEQETWKDGDVVNNISLASEEALCTLSALHYYTTGAGCIPRRKQRKHLRY
jgi:hypothetical protein